MPPPLLFLIRHGETDWNREARYQGHTDIPLNDHGRAQALRNGGALASVLHARSLIPGALEYVSSPLSRATETMSIIRRALHLGPDDFRRDPRLMEANYGAWEGLTVNEIDARDPGGFTRRARDPFGFAPPGGESYAQVAKRAMAAIEELTEPSVVVAHGGVSRVIRGALLGLTPAAALALPTPQDLVHVFENGHVTTV